LTVISEAHIPQRCSLLTSRDRTVAIKFLANPNRMENIQRTVRDEKMLVRVKSDQIMKIYKSGEVMNPIYLVIKLLDHGSVRKLLDWNGTLSLSESK
jgi:serine/threonine protein kinase